MFPPGTSGLEHLSSAKAFSLLNSPGHMIGPEVSSGPK